MARFTATLEPTQSGSLTQGLGWVVRVGWLRGKVDRDLMADWCERSIPWDDPDALRWQYDKGGNWYFRDRDDAVMFHMAWS